MSNKLDDVDLPRERHGAMLLWIVVIVVVLLLAYQLKAQGFNAWSFALLSLLVVILMRDVLVKLKMPGILAEFEHPKMRVGDAVITVQEATEQIRKQVRELQNAVTPSEAALLTSNPSLRSLQVLWVSGTISQSAVLLANLREDGIKVTHARSVKIALDMLKQGRVFDVFVCDFGVATGTENDVADVAAGLEQLASGPYGHIPIAVYASRKALLKYRSSPLVPNVFLTSSAIELRNHLIARQQEGSVDRSV